MHVLESSVLMVDKEVIVLIVFREVFECFLICVYFDNFFQFWMYARIFESVLYFWSDVRCDSHLP